MKEENNIMRKKCQKVVVLSLLISNIFTLSSTSPMAKSEKENRAKILLLLYFTVAFVSFSYLI